MRLREYPLNIYIYAEGLYITNIGTFNGFNALKENANNPKIAVEAYMLNINVKDKFTENNSTIENTFYYCRLRDLRTSIKTEIPNEDNSTIEAEALNVDAKNKLTINDSSLVLHSRI